MKDAFAILLCAQNPRLELLGLSTVHGNASLANTTKNSLSVLEAIGRRDIPVFPGAAKPFCREAVHAVDIHGRFARSIGTGCLGHVFKLFKVLPRVAKSPSMAF